MSINGTQKRRGRPATGEKPKINARLPADLLSRVEGYAAEQGIDRSSALRRLVERGLAADGGVTPDDLLNVAKISWAASMREDESLFPWEELIARANKARSRDFWIDIFDALHYYEPDDDLSEDFGDDAPLVRKVADLMRVVFIPPPK
jgi:hypothetical protein